MIAASSVSLRRLYRAACIGGAIGVLVLLAAAYMDRIATLVSYLLVWWFLLGIPLGSMAILFVHNLTGGAWGERIRPTLERAMGLLPWTLLMSAPLWLALPSLYAWARPQDVNASPLLQAKAWYLAVPLFSVREAICFAVWVGLSQLSRRYSAARFSDAGAAAARRVQVSSALGLLIYAVTLTVATVDWIMSLTPEWHSTTFGLLAGIGQALCAFSFAVAWAAWLAPSKRGDPGVFQDLGNLLLMFVMTWAYLAFTQYLIIWAEDLPNEIVWYLPRVRTSWRLLGIVVIVIHFALPFVVLLSRRAKRAPQTLGALAGMLLLAHLLDAFWLVAPTFEPTGFTVHVSDLFAVAALGGIWLALFIRSGPGSTADRSRASRQVVDHG